MVLRFARYHAPRLMKFAGVGVVNVTLDVAVWQIAYWFLSAYGYGELRAAGFANGVGWFAAVTCSYFLNSYFTFRHAGVRAPLRITAYLRFVAAGLAGLATSTAALLVVLEVLRRRYDPAPLPLWGPIGAKLVAVGVAFWVNYAASYLFVFKRLAREADAAEAADDAEGV